MIKFTATASDGSHILFLGISDRNVELLTAGKPIKIIGKEVGCNHDICIFHGHTEQAILDELRRSGIKMPAADKIRRHDDDDRQEGGEH